LPKVKLGGVEVHERRLDRRVDCAGEQVRPKQWDRGFRAESKLKRCEAGSSPAEL
jgi:hypothetical protein